MVLYNRLASIAVGAAGSEGVILDSIRIAFRVIKTQKKDANDINLTLYNLSKTTRTKFETTDNRIVLNAGYADSGLALLAIGDIVKGSTSFEAPDVVTSVVAKDGGKALRDARASLSYQQGVQVQTIIKDLVQRLDVDDVDLSGVDLTGTFPHGWSFFGQVSDGLSRLAANFGFDWSVQNNTIQLTEHRQPSQRQAIVLSPSSGLIGSPSRIDRTSSNQTKAKEPPGLKVTSLLNTALVPGDPVVVESREYPKATYRIDRVEHRGDTHGQEWVSELEVVEPGKKS